MLWEDYKALFWLSRGWRPAHIISTHMQPFLFMGGGTRLGIIAHMLMGRSCLFRLRALLHPCLSILEINYKNALKQVLCKVLFIYYLYPSKSFRMYWFRKYVYLVLSKKLDETKRSTKTDSFKLKVNKNDKNVILNFI